MFFSFSSLPKTEQFPENHLTSLYFLIKKKKKIEQRPHRNHEDGKSTVSLFQREGDVDLRNIHNLKVES